MKSVNVERARTRGSLVSAVCISVVLGFIACGGSAKKTTPPKGVGGGENSAGAAGAAEAGEHSGGASAEGGAENAGASSEAGAGGEPNGQSGAGGDSSHEGGASGAGTGESGASGEGGSGGKPDVVDPVCGVNLAQVGAYSLWCGKVNMHQGAEGIWLPDADCSSGCNVTGVNYCKKFYPTTTAVVTVAQTVTKDWKNAGCAESTPDGPGVSGEAACCAPLP